MKIEIGSNRKGETVWKVFGNGDVWFATFSYEKDAEMFVRAHDAWYSETREKTVFECQECSTKVITEESVPKRIWTIECPICGEGSHCQ